jgi:hypothetical protein
MKNHPASVRMRLLNLARAEQQDFQRLLIRSQTSAACTTTTDWRHNSLAHHDRGRIHNSKWAFARLLTTNNDDMSATSVDGIDDGTPGNEFSRTTEVLGMVFSDLRRLYV